MDVVDSTHAVCLRLMEQMDEESCKLDDTVVIAARQTQGVGRGDRRWESPTGGLYLSWIRTGLSESTILQLPMLAAASARTAISMLGVRNVGIKWPNDIVVEGHKLAGILIHARRGKSNWVTVGLGINLDTTPGVGADALFPPIALATLIKPEPQEYWCRSIVSEFISSLSQSLVDSEKWIESWRCHLVHQPGDLISVRISGEEVQTGVFEGLTPEGFLRVRQADAERVISGGDVIERS